MVTSLLALFVLVRRAITWLQSRAVWSWISEVWYQLLAWLPDLRLPFDLTLPEALQAVVEWGPDRRARPGRQSCCPSCGWP